MSDDDVQPIVLAIVGSRRVSNDFILRAHYAAWVQQNGVPDLIVSGDCKGIDTLAAQLATRNGIAFKYFEADWFTHGRAAGPIRNCDIVAACSHLLALPSKDSRGTRDTIRKAQRAGKHVTVVELE